MARIIDKSSTVWFYDGASSNALQGRREGKLKDTNPKTLLKCGSKKAVFVVYILDKSERISSD